MKIQNCKRNILGTVSFASKFDGMRKPQDFIVYPLQDSGTIITIQSATRFGTINLFDGLVTMSQSHPSGAYSVHLQVDKLVYSMISHEECMTLRGWVQSTGGVCVGDSLVKCDNTGAIAL